MQLLLPNVSVLIVIFLIQNIKTSGSFLFDDSDSEYEDELLAEFKIKISGDVTINFMKADVYLLRWLKHYNFDIERASENFKKAIKWRKEKNIDGILKEELKSISSEIPLQIQGLDKLGHPVVWGLAGSIDLRKIVLAGGYDLFQRFWCQFFELAEHYIYEIRQSTGIRNISQINAVFDMTGFNLRKTGCFQCLTVIPEFITNLESYYPSLFRRFNMINSPLVTETAFTIVRNFMSERTRETFSVMDFDKDKWFAVLLKQISLDQIPMEYGGTSRYVHRPQSELTNPIVKKIIETAKIELKTVNVDSTNSPHSDSTTTSLSKGMEEHFLNHSTSTTVIPFHHHQKHHHHYKNNKTSQVNNDLTQFDKPNKADKSIIKSNANYVIEHPSILIKLLMACFYLCN